MYERERESPGNTANGLDGAHLSFSNHQAMKRSNKGSDTATIFVYWWDETGNRRVEGQLSYKSFAYTNV